MSRRYGIVLALVTAVTILGQYVGEGEHHWWSYVPGFWAGFGFVGCVLIILVSKAVGRYLLARPESYYRPESNYREEGDDGS